MSQPATVRDLSSARVAPRVDAAIRVLTSESVSEGHPDKVCDAIADAVLDAYLALDRRSRVACEVLCKSGVVVLAGEISSVASLDHLQIVRDTVREIGYTDDDTPFSADSLQVLQHVTGQSWEIGRSVDPTTNLVGEQGAGDQGIVFGYATVETPERMPLPLLLAHALARGLADDRRSGACPWLRPDAKTQVSVEYEGFRPRRVTDVLVSTQHARDVELEPIRHYVTSVLAPRVLGEWHDPGIRFTVNPSGSFVKGGPAADAGVTGRKIIVDTYGGAARHGGGAFSGKDPSKVDRSGAYFCRYVARQLVNEGLAERVELQVAYAIGVAEPVAILVETFGTGDQIAAAEFVRRFDFRPAAIIERLDLLRPIYRQTTNYGHFGRPGLPWEC
ncbi:MAG TPA: methionine adenosyltransferase [Vicinamibacteria bacterium]|nr:methionine adenosyltransferase [Vicinamibacteria bacterium]